MKKSRVDNKQRFSRWREYYYEFLYQGSITGTHYTIDELMNSNLFIQMKDRISH